MHKIDREKLREVTGLLRMSMNYEDFKILRQAAENWLEITDPGFEVSIKMLQAAMDEQFEAETRGVNAYPQDVFKAMIAKAGE